MTVAAQVRDSAPLGTGNVKQPKPLDASARHDVAIGASLGRRVGNTEQEAGHRVARGAIQGSRPSFIIRRTLPLQAKGRGCNRIDDDPRAAFVITDLAIGRHGAVDVAPFGPPNGSPASPLQRNGSVSRSPRIGMVRRGGIWSQPVTRKPPQGDVARIQMS